MKRLVDDKKQELLDNLLESVSVDKEGNMEVGKNLGVDGKLTINSAKDLLTKDGTSLGGEDILDWSSKKITTEGLVLSDDDLAELSKHNKLKINIDEFGIFTFYYSFKTLEDVAFLIATSYAFITGSQAQLFVLILLDHTLNAAGVNYPTGLKVNGDTIILDNDITSTTNDIYINTINGTPVLDETGTKDIKVQHPLYCHTVEFSENGLGYHNRLTAYSEKNTVIDSVQDLITVFGNTKLQCSGTIESGSKPCIGIDVGTTAATTYFVGIGGENVKLSDWYMTQPDATLTITDSVTAM